MSRFEYVLNPKEPQRLVDIYQELLQLGFGKNVPPNWFTSLGSRVDLLDMGWSVVKTNLIEGELPPTLKQLIALAISVQNDNNYCVVVHSHVLKDLGVDRKVIESCIQNDSFEEIPPGQRSIIRFGLKCAKDPTSITDIDLEQLYDGGLSETEVMEVVMIALAANFTNGWAAVSGIAIDDKG